jgi:drug/metabolite transporter (DMT)-like permease
MNSTAGKYAPVDWLMLIGLSAMWGFSFFFIKKGLEAFSPTEVGAFRIFIAFCTLFPLLPFYKSRVSTSILGYILLAGMLGSGMPPFLFAFAETHVSSSVAGILNATTPLFALVFGVVIFGLRANVNQFLGVLIGFLGAILIVMSKMDDASGILEFHPFYGLLVVAATACYGLGANILKSKILVQDIHPIQISVYGFCFLGPFAGIYLTTQGVWQRLLTDSAAQHALSYLLILGIFGTGVAVLVFNMLTKRTSALFASFTTYLIPLVAILVGVIAGEQLQWSHITGFGVIMAGVLLANKKSASASLPDSGKCNEP